MKKVIKNSVLLLLLFVAAHSNANVVDSIVIKNQKENSIVKIEILKAGSLLKIKDKTGIILHKEKIGNTDNYIKNFDMSNLPDATYFFELDTDNEIRIIPVVIKDQKSTFLEGEKTIIAKPKVNLEGNMAIVRKSASENQDLDIKIYYEGTDLAFKESLKDTKDIVRSYDFTNSLKGDYTIVMNTMGRTFTQVINIP